jgi:GTPase SAR1 family protein
MKYEIVDSYDPTLPVRCLVYGLGGVGKSTFATTAPKAVFIAAEKGLSQVKARRLHPMPVTYGDILEGISFLTEDASCETIAIDSLDWIEPLLHAYVCARDKEPSIEMYGGGYGKGYEVAAAEWRDLFSRLDQSGKHVVLIAHSKRKAVKNTIGADYDATMIKIADKAAAIAVEWCDVVGYADLDTEIEVKGKQTAGKAVTTGKRIMRMTPHPGLTAKVRAPEGVIVPSRVPLAWYSVLRALGRIKKEEE